MTDMIAVISSGHTFKQKINYLKFRMYPKQEILAYDPVTISIVATGRCTLSCDMCPTHSRAVPRDYPHMQKFGRDMEFDMFRRIIDRFDNALSVHIIGSGEPLLNKDLFRMVDYASGRKMIVKTFSNGTTVSENIERIIGSKLDGITISINGHNSREFARMTGMDEEVYSKIYSGVKALVEEKVNHAACIKIKLSFIIDKYNYASIPDMVTLGMELGVDHMFFCNFLPAPYKGLTAAERTLMDEGDMTASLKRIFGQYPPSVRRMLTPPVLMKRDAKINRCDTHFSQIRFDGEGDFSSCSMMLLDMSGHGRYTDKEIWNGNYFRLMRRLFLLNDQSSLPEPCVYCPDNSGIKI